MRLDKATANRIMSPRTLCIQVALGAGRASATMLACDLTEAYVHINARYTT